MIIGNVSGFAYAVGVAVTIALATAVGSQIISRLSDAADRRRERYSVLVRTLVAWIEFPYRVRRRVDDDPVTLAGLAALGHDLQERLAGDQAWVLSENARVGKTYVEVRRAINEEVGPAISDAWKLPPVSKPSEMVLGIWGPNAASAAHLQRLEASIGQRFGWRRLRVATGFGRWDVDQACESPKARTVNAEKDS
jgi:hypothetical protein